MNENVHEAKQEMKRVDHLLYVSLKYTRTVDVIRSVVERMISSLDFAITVLLEDSKERKMISKIPPSPLERCDLLLKIFKSNNELKDYVDFYLLLRKIIRAPYGKREEYRRHVTMISKLDAGNVLEVNIDILYEYFEKTKGFVEFASNFAREK